jgi:hypothetical protein
LFRSYTWQPVFCYSTKKKNPAVIAAGGRLFYGRYDQVVNGAIGVIVSAATTFGALCLVVTTGLLFTNHLFRFAFPDQKCHKSYGCNSQYKQQD